MAKASSTIVTWGGIAFGVLVLLPRCLSAMQVSNARVATQTDPNAAIRAQLARLTNTAGGYGNAGLSDLLAALFKKNAQSSPGQGRAPNSIGTNAAAVRDKSSARPNPDSPFGNYDSPIGPQPDDASKSNAFWGVTPINYGGYTFGEFSGVDTPFGNYAEPIGPQQSASDSSSFYGVTPVNYGGYTFDQSGLDQYSASANEGYGSSDSTSDYSSMGSDWFDTNGFSSEDPGWSMFSDYYNANPNDGFAGGGVGDFGLWAGQDYQ